MIQKILNSEFLIPNSKGGEYSTQISGGDALEVGRQSMQIESRGDGIHARGSRGTRHVHERRKLGEVAIWFERPVHKCLRVAGAAPRQPVTNQTEPEIVRQHVRSRNERGQT